MLTATDKLRVVVVDDHPMFRDRLAQIINHELDMAVCAEAEDAQQALSTIEQTTPDLAIIDITGVPTVDTLVAQHLLKTIAAARLMGADCIISGIRPQIAQTMVHLGVELDVVSKATLADALALAFQRTGRTVVRRAAART